MKIARHKPGVEQSLFVSSSNYTLILSYPVPLPCCQSIATVAQSYSPSVPNGKQINGKYNNKSGPKSTQAGLIPSLHSSTSPFSQLSKKVRLCVTGTPRHEVRFSTDRPGQDLSIVARKVAVFKTERQQRRNENREKSEMSNSLDTFVSATCRALSFLQMLREMAALSSILVESRTRVSSFAGVRWSLPSSSNVTGSRRPSR